MGPEWCGESRLLSQWIVQKELLPRLHNPSRLNHVQVRTLIELVGFAPIAVRCGRRVDEPAPMSRGKVDCVRGAHDHAMSGEGLVMRAADDVTHDL